MSQDFDKLFIVHLVNSAGRVFKHETFAANKREAVKLAQAKQAKALVPETWFVSKVDLANA